MSANVLILLGAPEIDLYPDAVRKDFPHVSVRAADGPDNLDGDISATDVILTIGWKMNDAVLKRTPKLKWVQSVGVGVDGILSQASLPKDVIVTNVRDIHAEPVSEAALGLMLAIYRDMPAVVRNQSERRWGRFLPRLLYGKTVGILGVGAIGTGLARRCAALGMTVVGISASPRPVEGFSRIYPRADMLEAVKNLDFLVLLTPLTPETRNIISDKVLGAMKASSVLINVARGGIVDEDALIRALENRTIAAAGLDVFATEPLPAASKLWSLPNAILTPHQGGIHEDFVAWNMKTIGHNFRAYLAGKTADMINIVPRP